MIIESSWVSGHQNLVDSHIRCGSEEKSAQEREPIGSMYTQELGIGCQVIKQNT